MLVAGAAISEEVYASVALAEAERTGNKKAGRKKANKAKKAAHALLDEQDGRGYSCMTMIDAETVGIIYEGSQADMTFQRVKLDDLLKPPTNQKTKNTAQVLNEPAAVVEMKSEFAFARVFGDHMVLQAQQPIRVWGHANHGSRVAVQLGNTTANLCDL